MYYLNIYSVCILMLETSPQQFPFGASIVHNILMVTAWHLPEVKASGVRKLCLYDWLWMLLLVRMVSFIQQGCIHIAKMWLCQSNILYRILVDDILNKMVFELDWPCNYCLSKTEQQWSVVQKLACWVQYANHRHLILDLDTSLWWAWTHPFANGPWRST